MKFSFLDLYVYARGGNRYLLLHYKNDKVSYVNFARNITPSDISLEKVEFTIYRTERFKVDNTKMIFDIRNDNFIIGKRRGKFWTIRSTNYFTRNYTILFVFIFKENIRKS